MRINSVALGATAALIWGAAILFVASANLIWPPYGRAFLDLVASIYPGYHPGPGAGSVITGTLYGMVDAGIGGAVFGGLYNLLARRIAGPSRPRR
jgi:hypothetical protein